jgi:hypothetical protein
MKNVLLTTAALSAIVREASASWTMINGAGTCTIVGDCVYDSGGATGNYGNNEYCKFEYSGDAQIMRDDHQEAWGVEDHRTCRYDSLWVHGTKYCGYKDGARAFPAAGVQVTGTNHFRRGK